MLHNLDVHIGVSADWRDPASYPDESFSGDRWAWECLRRNKTFQLELRASSGLQAGAYMAFLHRWGIAKLWSAQEMDARGFDAPCAFKPAVTLIATLPAQRLLNAPDIGTALIFVHPALDGEVAFAFNPRESIAAQLDVVKRALEDRQKDLGIYPLKEVRTRRADYVKYLRAFDGKDAGEGHKGIANVLSHEGLKADEGQVGKWIKEAEDLIYGFGYIQIPRITHNAWDKARRQIEEE